MGKMTLNIDTKAHQNPKHIKLWDNRHTQKLQTAKFYPYVIHQGPSGKGDKMMVTKQGKNTKDVQELLTKSRTK